ncbi:UDP-glucose:glycoprotein glucosyltransferase 1 isoform X1 [Marmota marmota marmota]|uniref:UDP-glucose:glycoprotein glucosyltransferase 1 isoform X1 n=2 Tax=Marmota marmota marmota TaxID=9994 RepID=UPI00209291AF|nr:UDP-glucose:glycoprotein glucosyltransferase 1 isoform X1 [Marmota marmota marmota]XP_048668115.1 UDP-glucose:glycoprotein glucosyltransferase 1 isoform X1 [Marmota marmota marmota]XP_048668116.1 UDP-glucose:glycoprotein glucosyltransferase 1 isoform X1 [Marmota marmota marmota]
MELLIALTGLWLFSSVKADSKAITTSLTTKWFSTPLLLEASEFLAEDSQEKFWNFVEASQNIGSSDHHGTDYSYYHAILEAAFQFLSPLQQNLLKFCLSLRSYSATIQAFQQIAANEPPPEGCDSFFSVHGKKTCDFHTLETLLLTASERPKPLLFKGDHRYPSSNPESPVVIFYSEIGYENFSNFHHQLISKSNLGKINYVFRHYLSNPRREPVHLSGYGVELAIKSTEYKAKDDTQVKGTEVNTTVIGENDPIDEVQGFLFGKLRDLHPDLKEQLKELRKHLVESTNEMAPLKVWQLQDLSFQAAARILSAPVELALVVMKDLSQNFPTKARAITKTAVSSELRTEVEENQKYFKGTLGIQPGDCALFINGLHIDLDTQDIFSLFDVLRNEARVMEGLHRLGIEGIALHNILKLNIQPSEADYAVDIRSSAISWVNNLEADSRYNSWPSSLQELLRPTFPGVIRQIRKNLHNMVIIVDPAHEATAELINTAEMFLSNHIPLRIGFVFVVNDSEDVDGMQDAGVAVLRAYNYVVQEVDDYHAFQTLTHIYNKVRTGEKVKVEHVISVLEKKYPYVEVNSILGIDSAYDQNRKEGRGYYEQTGVGPLPVVLFNGMPFEKEQLDPDELETITMHKILETTTFFQRAVYLGELSHDQDVVEYIMNQPNVVPRINSRILTAEREYLDLTASIPRTMLNRSGESDYQDNFFVDDYARFSVLDSQGKTAALANSMNYLTKKGMSSKEIYDDSFIRPVTFWIVGDFGTPSGRQLLYDAIKHQKSSNNVRISMINNPSEEINYENTQIARAIWAALQTQTSNSAKNFITKMAKEETAEALAIGADIGEFSVGGMDFSLFKEVFESSKMDFILSHAVYCRDVLKLKKGQRAVISNGRIIGPLEDSELFNQDDFHLLENIILKTSGQKIKSHIQQLRVEEDVASDLVMKVDALLSAQPKGDARIEYRFFEDRHSAIKLRPKEGETYFDVMAVVDPVTREAQRLAPLLLVLTQLINMNLRIFMNCQSKLSDMPLKSFYRYVLEPEISFTSDNSFAKGPIAKFLDMPQSPLFTLNLNTPESWMVESVRTPYDLDNIYLEEVDSIVAAEYELEYLLLEGHCYDITTGQPPRGLQFTLGTSADPVIVDTIVMANLGYFQLKANPGAWLLRLRKGRSEDIYRIYSHDGTDSPPDADEVVVVLNNFKSKIIKVKVQKKADMVNEDLLSDGTNENESGFWDSFKWGFSGGQKAEEVKQDKDDIINIFSVASGHLYERFLRIMMLSVLKNTKTPVKFWFLKNYLSPTFKEFIPYMANEYNFQYELVQYKWPRWLHQQTEKQRIIWGYKILFLDVLFPLVVDKFLFVDADQIVRTDLKELRDFNLDGAPYGYTPFCDSRREMDGYRFWKSGYWASHLAGRKYHISALYVVDLKKFRKIAAGDRLRGQYQGLSQDPNSLSNLDQDLPNNMIHQVPIKSLPQEWLWCETWCDDASKKRAKTIDLCNNPMTKEPKLEAAVRIVPEWQDYDQEIKQLQTRFQKEKEIGILYKGKTKNQSQEEYQKHEEL